MSTELRGSKKEKKKKTFSMRTLVAYRIGRQWWCKKEGNKGLIII